MKAQDLVGKSLKLVTLPDVYLRAKAVLDDPDSSAQDMARAIEYDPGMTVRLLRITNSAFFGFAASVETVSRAVSLLGNQQIHDLVLATSLANVFKGVNPAVMDMDKFWHDSVYRAVAAKLLAAHCNVLDDERLFVAGLLCDIGHLIMFQQIPDLAQRAAVDAAQLKKPLHRLERQLIGFDYAELGGELLEAWRLPASLVQTVRHQSEPRAATDYALETAIVHIAWGLQRFTSQPGLSMRVDGDAARLTGLDGALLRHIRDEVDAQVADAVALIFSDRRSAA